MHKSKKWLAFANHYYLTVLLLKAREIIFCFVRYANAVHRALMRLES
jgi:hypothetical protein